MGDEARIIQIMPAVGWCVWMLEHDAGLVRYPLTAWGLDADGQVIPLLSDADGMVSDASDTRAWDCFVAIYPDDGSRPTEDMVKVTRDRLRMAGENRQRGRCDL